MNPNSQEIHLLHCLEEVSELESKRPITHSLNKYSQRAYYLQDSGATVLFLA